MEARHRCSEEQRELQICSLSKFLFCSSTSCPISQKVNFHNVLRNGVNFGQHIFFFIYTGVDDLPNAILEDERGGFPTLVHSVPAKDGQCCDKKCDCERVSGICPEIDSTSPNDYLYCLKCQCMAIFAKCSARCRPIVTLHGQHPLIDDNAPL